MSRFRVLIPVLALVTLNACSSSSETEQPATEDAPPAKFATPRSSLTQDAPHGLATAEMPQTAMSRATDSMPPMVPSSAPTSPPTEERPTDNGLMLPPSLSPRLPPPIADPPANWTLTQDEVTQLFEGVSLTYAFDACGLPLLGEEARKDIGRRLEQCPNTDTRKGQLQAVYQRALEMAERDRTATLAQSAKLCPDKAAFLRNVMNHADEMRFDPERPDCRTISLPSLGSAASAPTGNPESAAGKSPHTE